MIKIPILRWGDPYTSVETDQVVHFDTGEVLAEVSRANAALVERDMRFAKRAREVLRRVRGTTVRTARISPGNAVRNLKLC